MSVVNAIEGMVKPMVENEVQNIHAQELISIHLVNKSITSYHFGWGATECISSENYPFSFSTELACSIIG